MSYKNYADKLAAQRRGYAQNRAERIARVKAYQEAHPDKVREWKLISYHRRKPARPKKATPAELVAKAKALAAEALAARARGYDGKLTPRGI